jgi:D-apionolactonase
MIDLRILNGQTGFVTQPITLHWGPCTAVYRNGALRDISTNNLVVLSQIYAAVRDHNWQTVNGVFSNVKVDQRADSCRVTFQSTHQYGEIDFEWRGTITGERDGTLTFKLDGKANTTFRRNRIGFCVLHPMSAAGVACRIEHTNGTETASHLPQAISPHQPFFDIQAIHHEVAPGLWIETRMTGDTFEMEDQRNWTDASFKTYCTPLGEPFPVTVEAGTEIEQQIVVRLRGSVPEVGLLTSSSARVDIQKDRHALPRIGLGEATHGEPLSARAIERLRALNLAHLRVDLHFREAAWRQVLMRAIDEANAIGCTLELAVHLADNAELELQALREALAKVELGVARVLVFRDDEKSIAATWVELARRILEIDAPIGGGTDAYFTELNRERPQTEYFDVVSYSTNPQVHAFDDASLVETLQVAPVTVATAKTFCGSKPIIISPITFRIRWNPNATSAPPPTPAGELPDQVDARQMSLFGAGWTLGSLKYLCASGVHALTYFETTGWLGVIERDSGSPLPDKFPSVAGGVFPMYHVFADIGDFTGGDCIECTSSQPQRVETLVLTHKGRMRVILANFTADDQAVTLTGLPFMMFTGRSLNADNALYAMTDPEAYRRQQDVRFDVRDGTLQVTLPPFGLLTLDGNQ